MLYIKGIKIYNMITFEDAITARNNAIQEFCASEYTERHGK
jgi:hypothetical protein